MVGRRAWGVLAVASLASGMLVGCAPTLAPACGSLTALDATVVPAGPVRGYDHDQLVNAATIVRAGADLGLGTRDQTIGVMTAMGESSLRNVDSGDAAGPDSRGLFQQRDNGAWGTYADRMDPYTAATSFFRALAAVPAREGMSPTQAAHAVQRNADVNHYAQYWDAAVEVVGAVSTAAGCPVDVYDPTYFPAVSADGTYRVPRSGSGNVPAEYLCQVPWEVAGTRLRCDAVQALAGLDAAYRVRFGVHLRLPGGNAYRDFAAQITTKNRAGALAAAPGTSNHGWGLAADFSGLKAGTEQYQWLRATAPAYGWDHPSWARAGGSKPESWHWEYVQQGASA